MTVAMTQEVDARVRTSLNVGRLDLPQLIDEAITAPPNGFTSGEYLTFRLGREEYAIDILKVQEIRSYERPTRIANVPEHIKGVINLRGVIVTVVDLRMRFGAAEIVYDDFTVVVVVSMGGRVFGIVVDAVNDVERFDDGNVRPTPDFSAAIDASHILGLGNLQDRMVILINIERLLTSPEFGLSGR